MPEGSAKKWFKYGCLGCVGLIGMAVLSGACVVGVAWLQSNKEEVEDRVLRPDLPATTPIPPADAETADRETAEVALIPSTTGRVILELSQAGFTVKPARPGEPMRVEATFDKTSYELTESLDEADDGSWVYRVGFNQTGFGLIKSIKQAFSGNEPEVHVWLPRDAEIALDVNIGQGAAEIELGGLWLTSAELEVNTGALDIDFREPTKRPMERLAIDGSMSAYAAGGLGNASPRQLVLGSTMGAMDVDLRGEWLADSDVTVRFSMSGASLRLPRDVTIAGVEGHSRVFEPDPPAEVPPPTLTFTISGDPKNIQIR
jgi:hypothetical protein